MIKIINMNYLIFLINHIASFLFLIAGMILISTNHFILGLLCYNVAGTWAIYGLLIKYLCKHKRG